MSTTTQLDEQNNTKKERKVERGDEEKETLGCSGIYHCRRSLRDHDWLGNCVSASEVKEAEKHRITSLYMKGGGEGNEVQREGTQTGRERVRRCVSSVSGKEV